MRGNNILAWGAARSWAILPETLSAMAEFALRDKLDAEDFRPLVQHTKTTQERLEIQMAMDKGQTLSGTENVVMRDGVALISMIGPIFRYGDMFSEMSGALTLDQLRSDYEVALKNPAVKSILFVIDSPGGEAAGIGDFAQYISETRVKKPVKAFAAYQCCSAAYWLAAATESISASSTSVVGSIGAVVQANNPDFQKEKKPLTFVSAKSKKKAPDLSTEEGKSVIQDRVDALGEIFMESVANLRGMKIEDVEATEGAALVGKYALEAGLTDKITTLEAVVQSMVPRMGGNMAKNTGFIAALKEAFTALEEDETLSDPIVAPTEQMNISPSDIAELAQLRADKAKLQGEKLQMEATAFAKDIIFANKALPAEMTDLIEAYLDAAMDDLHHGPLTLADGVIVNRTDRVKARQDRRIPHTLVDTTPKQPEKLRVIHNPEFSDQNRNKPMTAEREEYLLSLTPEGQETLRLRKLGQA